ncbi:MAG: hypothetical protein KGY70_20005 [Bacteroidales bacterium]|nr:hypothetical protein [Bacteroidales bacterium]
MNKEERKELAEILYGLAGNFGDSVDDQTAKIWARGFEFEGITMDQIKAAAMRILKTRTISKMPTFAEFLEAINGSKKDNAQAQADIVFETLRRNGATSEPIFEDPVTNHLMSTRWKWKNWASSVLEDEIKWWRKEFIEAYQSYAANPENVEQVQKLTAPQRLQKLISGIGDENPEKQEPALIEEEQCQK